MKRFNYLFVFLLFMCFAAIAEPTPLKIGEKAPDFNLKGTDGKMYSLASFSESKILVIVFTCNHCPTSQAYEARLKQLVIDYVPKKVQVIAISPNDPTSVRLDEMGYTDLGDSFEDMQIRAKDHGFNFPYLYDGDTEGVSLKYGPAATPHVFIFDDKRTLRYSGRIDDVENPKKTPNNFDTRNALDDLLNDKQVRVQTTKTFGCSIKWAEKKVLTSKEKEEWAKEAVTLDTIDAEGIKSLLANKTDKLRLINIWATWCGPCVTELPDFNAINHMYRRRDFEFITISADKPDKQSKALKVLKNLQMSAKNYIYNAEDSYKLIELIDPKWQGALPYTLLIEPNGKVIYAKQSTIDPLDLKRRIVDNPVIGRVY